MSKVVYIVSYGHSGSTLLDLLIGSLPGTFSSGELVCLPWQLSRGWNFKDKQTHCSCGASFSTCKIWASVFNKIKEEKNIDIVKKPRKFDISMNLPFDLYGSNFRLKTYNFLIWKVYKYFPKFIWRLVVKLYQTQLDNYKVLVDSVCKTSQVNYLIDSTKNLIRYLILKEAFPDDIKLIVLVRGIHGVISSNHSKNELSPEKKINRIRGWEKLYSVRIPVVLRKLKSKDYIILNYYELSKNPELIREQCASFLGISDIDSLFQINTSFTHTVAGNPMRHNGQIKIREDIRWKNRLSEEEIIDLNKIQEETYSILYKKD